MQPLRLFAWNLLTLAVLLDGASEPCGDSSLCADILPFRRLLNSLLETLIVTLFATFSILTIVEVVIVVILFRQDS